MALAGAEGSVLMAQIFSNPWITSHEEWAQQASVHWSAHFSPVLSLRFSHDRTESQMPKQIYKAEWCDLMIKGEGIKEVPFLSLHAELGKAMSMWFPAPIQ